MSKLRTALVIVSVSVVSALGGAVGICAFLAPHIGELITERDAAKAQAEKSKPKRLLRPGAFSDYSTSG